MRLKEIEPGMVIHCKKSKEADILVRKLHGSDKWKNYWSCYGENTCYLIDENGLSSYGHRGNYREYPIIEFSDLIIPELSPAEVLNICNEMCHNASSCIDCEICGNCFYEKDSDYQKVVEICEQWKADHEKKELEVEWFWQGRIYKIHDNDKGNFYQLKDGKGFYDTGCVNEESAEEYMADVLKDYCKDHEGEFISVVTHVCRVKR